MSFFTKRNRSNSSKGQDQPAPPSASSSNAKPTPSSSLDQLSSASPSPPQPQQPAQFANQQQQQQRNRTVSASSQGGTRGGPMGPPPPPPAQVNSLDQRRAPAPAVGRGFPSEQPAQGPPPPSKPILPWSVRRLNLPHSPPSTSTAPPDPSLTPFPRYGLSTPPHASPSGNLFLFGGLVSQNVRSDLFNLDCRTLTIVPIPARGDVPMPRVGHATACVGNIMITWGGDTKQDPEDVNDQGLYLLNMATNDWSCIRTDGIHKGSQRREMPLGRYGHAVCMYNNLFFVFGGQENNEFFNDIWVFNLSNIKSDEGGSWERVVPENKGPSARTGHIAVTYKDHIFVFGGTDGEFHYNDVWVYNIHAREWEELACCGYLPVAREGHSAALVGDVIYVFGGRDVLGKDLGDLAAFKISTRRWYMFQNMGPAPSPRSGHAMASFGEKVYVLGGEALTTPPDPSDMIHVLDTSKIQYPRGDRPPPPGSVQTPTDSRKVSLASQSERGDPSQQQQQNARSDSAAGQNPQNGMMQSAHPSSNQNFSSMPPSSSSHIPPSSSNQSQPHYPNQPPPQQQPSYPQPQQSYPPSQQQSNLPSPPSNDFGSGISSRPYSPAGGPGQRDDSSKSSKRSIPQRPRREGDEVYGVGESRPLSPEGSYSSANPPRSGSAGPSQQSPVIASFPFQSNGPSRRPTIDERTESSSSNYYTPAVEIPGIVAPRSNIPSSLRMSARSPSPGGAGEVPPSSASSFYPPPDAFYNPRSTQLNGVTPSSSNQGSLGFGHGRQGSLSGVAGADLMREMKAKDQALDTAKSKERWLRYELGRALKAGYMVEDMTEGKKEDFDTLGEDGSELRLLAEGLMKLKKEKSRLQSDLASQVQHNSQRFAEAERTRQGAIQEAAFYRAKIAALELGSPTDIAKVESDRSAELERHLNSINSEHTALQRQLAQLQEAASLEKQLRQAAEEREAEAVQRAVLVETDHTRATEELSDLQQKHSNIDSKLREHVQRLISLDSLVQQHDTEKGTFRSSLDELQSSRDNHLRALEEAQAALKTAGARTSEVESLYERESERVRQLENKVAELRHELETQTRESAAATARLGSVESAWAKTKEEVESLRNLSTGGLDQLLDLHKDIKNDTDRATRGHAEKTQAMDQEASSLRKMLHEAGTRMEETQSALVEHRNRTRQLEAEQIASRSSVQVARRAHASVLAESGQLREQLSKLQDEVKERSSTASELELRLNMLRNVLADSGIAISDEDLRSEEGVSSFRLRELEGKLAEKAHLHEETERELDLSKQRVEMAEKHADELKKKLESLSAGRSASTTTDGIVSPSPDDLKAMEARALAAEKSLADDATKYEAIHKEYQQAVHYVKGTERMLRRQKEDAKKQKLANAALQAELDALRGIDSSEAGSRTRDANGRNTPQPDDPSSSEALRLKLADAQRQLSQFTKLSSDHQSLTTEHTQLKDEHAQLRDAYIQEMEQANDRIDRLQAEVERLVGVNAGMQDGKRLQIEVEELRNENEDLQRKVRILLEAQDYEEGELSEREGGLRRPSDGSHFGSDDEELNEEDLNQYIRAHSPPGAHNGPALSLHGQLGSHR